MVDETKRFKDNLQKYEKMIVLHWLAGTAIGAVDWLDSRYNGHGSIAYFNIVCKNGENIKLGDPANGWFHNTNLGSKFDKKTIPIALEMDDEKDLLTDSMLTTLAELINEYSERFDITIITHHHKLYPPKPDFPDDLFKFIMSKVSILLT